MQCAKLGYSRNLAPSDVRRRDFARQADFTCARGRDARALCAAARVRRVLAAAACGADGSGRSVELPATAQTGSAGPTSAETGRERAAETASETRGEASPETRGEAGAESGHRAQGQA